MANDTDGSRRMIHELTRNNSNQSLFVLFRVSSWIALLPPHQLAAFAEHCKSTLLAAC
jgi:hypothetical protein